MSDLSRCVPVCPSQYYENTDSNGTKECLSCVSGCALCSSADNCEAWLGQNPNEDEGVFSDKLEFWLLLIIVVAVLLVVIVYCLVKRHLAKEEELE